MKNTGIVILCCIFVVAIIPMINVKTIISQENSIKMISVYNTIESKTETMNIEEYVLKVLEEEMPASYEMEALKAQAIAIRTYALRKMDSDAENHFGADVCTDYKHCMAYMFNPTEKWGDKANEYIYKYQRAVDETAGMILTYNNELAATFFFSLSAGKTQNCYDVWGKDIPYLRSVDSKVDKLRKNYETFLEFSDIELNKKLGINLEENFYIEHFENGYVKNLISGDDKLSGTEVREKLDLRSSAFQIEKKDTKYKFTVYGYGHGVGMSQQGADEMAKQGSNYQEILYHYYNGTTINNFNYKKPGN
ncbi:MAG: stage II sporulation protein D [Clostridia bacterium]|nr:stage II sporulation protein D [Clostridia bacterium]